MVKEIQALLPQALFPVFHVHAPHHSRSIIFEQQHGVLAPHLRRRRRIGGSSRPSRYCACALELETLPHQEILTITVGGRQIILETGEIGRQANGAVLVRDGETVLYTTACCQGKAGEQAGFVPFSVTYSERFSAAGRTSGSFFRREGRPNINEMIISRLTDRPLRPMLPKEWAVDTQVLSWLMSYDGQHQPEPLAITAAGTAMAISDIPLSKAVAGVHVGFVDGSFVVNPTAQQLADSSLDLVMAGTADAILMIEGFCDFLSEAQMLEALRIGSEAISHICREIQTWAGKVGKKKRTDLVSLDTAFDNLLASSTFAAEMMDTYRKKLGKHERAAVITDIKARAASEILASSKPDETEGSGEDERVKNLTQALKRLEAKVMRDLIIEEGIRADGRGLTDVRPITSRCGILPRTHGSVLFTRGETQSIAVTTLGSSEMAMKQDYVASEEEGPRTFYLQYSFPPSSVGETGRVGAPGRREVGHGMLAERALQPVIPDEAMFDIMDPSTISQAAYGAELFPYTIRVESTITESNGSSSMASVCGGCLALQDAGVPIKRQVAGVAMGLILTKEGRYSILTDILGSEDALGDMDFKVAGDAQGITAFQMDVKVEGVSLQIMEEALTQAKAGRQHILNEMAECSPPPRAALGPHAPHIERISIDPSQEMTNTTMTVQIGQVIGSGGKTIRSIKELAGCTNVQLINEVEGLFEISADSKEALTAVNQMIMSLVEEPEQGKIYKGVKVVGIEKFGMFVEFLPTRTGLVHFSELALGEELNDFDLNDEIDVVLLAVETSGKFKLSRKALEGGNNGAGTDGGTGQRPTPGTIFREAKVIDIKPYGVFVELQQGVSGLVHNSELWKNDEEREPFCVGDLIPVLVLEPREGKQAFSRKQAFNNMLLEGAASLA